MNVVGIDISKAQLDVATGAKSDVRSLPYSEDSLTALIEEFRRTSPDLIIVEATGGLERALVAHFAEAALPVVIVNPRQVRDFAKATGKLAKTDAIDARVLAHFGETIQPEIRPLKEPERQILTDLVTRRQQIMAMLRQEKNRLLMATTSVRPDIQAHITYLENSKTLMDAEIEQIIETTPIYADKAHLMSTVPGIGPVTAAGVLAFCPELGQLSRQKIAALAGLAPFNHDSGKRHGVRSIWGGRKHLRGSLYMATVAATRCNDVIKTFYQRLIASGKKPKVALTACMRKLLTILNAMVKANQPWQTRDTVTA